MEPGNVRSSDDSRVRQKKTDDAAPNLFHIECSAKYSSLVFDFDAAIA